MADQIQSLHDKRAAAGARYRAAVIELHAALVELLGIELALDDLGAEFRGFGRHIYELVSKPLRHPKFLPGHEMPAGWFSKPQRRADELLTRKKD